MLSTLTLILIVTAFFLSLILTRMSRAIGHRLSLLDTPDNNHKTHQRPVPATGGIGITATFISLIALGLAATWLLPTSFFNNLSPNIATHLPGIKSQTPFAISLLFAVLILHIMGIIDDRKPLGPFIKLFIQIAVTTFIIITYNVRLLELAGPIPSTLITLFWFIVIINAFNFLDNMDGLSAGVAIITAAMLLLTAVFSGQWFIAATLAILIGALLGFLIFNFPPASIFMGDGGSLVIGFIIAFAAIRITYVPPTASLHGFQNVWWSVLSPVIILAIPIYDFTSVTLIRIMQGKSPFVGDTQHFSHRLVRKGLSRRAAVGIIWACSLATGLGGVVIPFLDLHFAILIILQTAAIILVLALLEYKTPQNENRQ